MPRYTAWIPVYASVRYELETEVALEGEALKEAMLARGQPTGSLCHQCSNGIEIDVYDPAAGARFDVRELTGEEGEA